MTARSIAILAGLVLVRTGHAQQPADAALLHCAERSTALCVSTRVDLEPSTVRRLMAVDPDSVKHGWKARFGRDTAMAGGGQPLAVGTGRVLFLLDVSGSMKGGRDATARLVLRQFLRALDSLPRGSIRVAIAPFGSVNVASRIRAARFSIPDSAAAAIEALPAPERENTGLFSAVTFAIERLRSELAQAPPGSAGLLVIVTDGNNDVRPGDDAGLLVGAPGLATAARAVEESPIGVGIVGIGDLDRRALGSLAGSRGQTFVVSETPGLFELAKPLSQIRRMLWRSWDVTIRLAATNRAELGRAPGDLGVDLQVGKDRVPGGVGVWRPPLVALPAFAGTVPNGVLSATLVRSDGSSGWIGTALLAAFLVLLLVEVWIVLPRFLWPPVVPAAAGPAPAKAPVASPRGAGGLRTDLKEIAPRKPTDVTASKARRA